MSSSFNLASEVHVFPCPNCQETINTSVRECPFCHSAIDASAAEASAERTSRISQACSDASYLKVMAICGAGFFVLRFIPFLGFLGELGFLFLSVAVPVMCTRWWFKFGNILTDDPDFRQARRNAILATTAGGFYLLLFFMWIGMMVLVAMRR